MYLAVLEGADEAVTVSVCEGCPTVDLVFHKGADVREREGELSVAGLTSSLAPFESSPNESISHS